MDDDVCRECTRVGKIGKLGRECECASALESVKMYSVASCMQACQTTAYSQLWFIILLTAGLARGPRSELSYYFSDNSTIYVHSDLIVELFSNSYIYSRLVICLSNYDSAYATVNLVQSLGRVIFPS